MSNPGLSRYPIGGSGLVNTASQYTRGLIWLSAIQPTTAAATMRHRNMLHRGANYAIGGGTTGFAYRMSPYGPAVTLTAANNGAITIPTPTLGTGVARSFLSLIYVTAVPASAFCGGFAASTTSLGTLAFSAGGALTAQLTDSAAAVQTATGPVVVANGIYPAACSWNPGKELTLAVLGQLYKVAFTTLANAAATGISALHNLSCCAIMSAGWTRALSDTELVALTLEPSSPWQLFWKPTWMTVFDQPAAGTFNPAWAMGSTSMIGAGIAA